jgi:hypothetical protein
LSLTVKGTRLHIVKAGHSFDDQYG